MLGSRRQDVSSREASLTIRIGQGDQPGGAAETHVSRTPAGEKTTSANTSGPYWG